MPNSQPVPSPHMGDLEGGGRGGMGHSMQVLPRAPVAGTQSRAAPEHNSKCG